MGLSFPLFYPKGQMLVGLDFGSHSIKACKFTRDGQQLELESIGTIRTPENSIEDGAINDPDALRTALKELFDSLGLKKAHVGVSASGGAVVVKKIMLAQMPDDQVRQQILNGAEQYIPFAPADAYLDFHITDRNDETGRMEVLIVAVKRDLVESYLDILRDIDMIPMTVDVDSFALENIVDHAYSLDKKDVALVNIGALSTTVNLIKDGKPVVARDLNFGSEQLSDRLQNILEISEEEAEAIKTGQKPGEFTAACQEELVSVCTYWAVEIRKLIRKAFKKPDTEISQVILSGGGSKLPGLAAFCQQELDIPTIIVNPLRNVHVPEDKFDPAYVRAIGPEIAIAAGVALRVAGE